MRFVLDCIPPKHTAQGSNKILKSRDGHYFVGKMENSRAKQTQFELISLMLPYKPENPFTGALKLEIEWVYPFRKSEPLKNRKKDIYCDKRPDCDNLEKLVLDIMTRLGFWEDDSQVADLHFIKKWGNHPRIEINIETLV